MYLGCLCKSSPRILSPLVIVDIPSCVIPLLDCVAPPHFPEFRRVFILLVYLSLHFSVAPCEFFAFVCSIFPYSCNLIPVYSVARLACVSSVSLVICLSVSYSLFVLLVSLLPLPCIILSVCFLVSYILCVSLLSLISWF